MKKKINTESTYIKKSKKKQRQRNNRKTKKSKVRKCGVFRLCFKTGKFTKYI